MTAKDGNSEAFKQEIQDKYLMHMNQAELFKTVLAALNQHALTLKSIPHEAPPAIKMYSRYELAKEFSVDPQTVSEWVVQGILPKPLVFGKKKYFTHTQIQNLLEEKTKQLNK